jgi:HK97 family phage major capsid protein
MSLKELREAIGQKSKELKAIWSEAGEDRDLSKVKSLDGDNAAKLDTINQKTTELNELHAEFEKKNKMDVDAKRVAELDKEFNKAASPIEFPGQDPGGHAAPTKDLGQLFCESKAYKEKGKEARLDIELKTIMTATSSWAPESLRIPRIEQYPLRALTVADYFPMFTTDMSSIKYMEETTFTNNAAEIAEESNAAAPTAYGEAALAFTERSVPIEKIAVWLPITDEQLEDVVGVGQYVNDRLAFMIRYKLDGQLIAGDGSTPNLRGVLNATNIQTQALGTDTVPDAIYKAATLVRATGFAEPSVVMMHPNDWQSVRLLRTADGIYIFGNPTEPGPERIWGIPIALTTAETENTAVVGDFARFAGLYVKRGVDVKVTDSHGELFTAGVQAVRATMRCAAVYFRGTAFCKVTGI